MNKFFLSIGLLLLAIASSTHASSVEHAVDAMNFPLSRVMVPYRTYVGVLVDSKDVTVSVGPRGLIRGLTMGLANFAFGTDIGAKAIRVHQYVVRLDQPDDREAEIITVVQGGGPLVPAGSPVFLATQTSKDGFVFSVRMIACDVPDVYGTIGMEEARLARRSGERRHAGQ